MKILMTLILSLFAAAAMAAPARNDIDQKALEIFIKNSGKMKSQDGQSGATLLAQFLTTGDKTHDKINNDCKLNGQTESSMSYTYELWLGSTVRKLGLYRGSFLSADGCDSTFSRPRFKPLSDGSTFLFSF